MIDFLVIRDLLGPAACYALRAELQEAGGQPAALLGAAGPPPVRPQVRRATRLTVEAATCARVTQLLVEQKPSLERHFALALGQCEEPQFLRYLAGDFFVPHQD